MREVHSEEKIEELIKTIEEKKYSDIQKSIEKAILLRGQKNRGP